MQHPTRAHDHSTSLSRSTQADATGRRAGHDRTRERAGLEGGKPQQQGYGLIVTNHPRDFFRRDIPSLRERPGLGPDSGETGLGSGVGQCADLGRRARFPKQRCNDEGSAQCDEPISS